MTVEKQVDVPPRSKSSWGWLKHVAVLHAHMPTTRYRKRVHDALQVENVVGEDSTADIGVGLLHDQRGDLTSKFVQTEQSTMQIHGPLGDPFTSW